MTRRKIDAQKMKEIKAKLQAELDHAKKQEEPEKSKLMTQAYENFRRATNWY